MSDVEFREARTVEEIDQLQRLNYRTFSEELGQHGQRADGVLADRFHETNRYFVAVECGAVIGMVSLNVTPPFSIEKRLPQGIAVADVAARPCEVRLLAIEPRARGGVVVAGLFWQVFDAARRDGRSHMLISGVTGRGAMYEELGFRTLGPAIAEGQASFVPMALDLNDVALLRKSERFKSWWMRRTPRREVRLLPGPVQMSERVQRAFLSPPVSHRDPGLVDVFDLTRRRLSVVAGGMPVAIMTGSGTLANDAIAACVRSSFGDRRGLVLANGEFGGRLERLARRAGLRVAELHWEWGTAWDHGEIERELMEDVAWVWGVHLETSTGQVNDLTRLIETCSRREVVVVADCVSSFGALPVPKGLFLASGVSGKSLGSYAGLAFVFAGEGTTDRVRGEELPASFDIVEAIGRREPMFTVPSPLLLALAAALQENYADAEAVERRFAHYARLGEWVRAELRSRGIQPIAENTAATAPIVSFAVPSAEAMRACSGAGYRIAHESEYLRQRGWAQISVMGDLDKAIIAPVFDLLHTPVAVKTIAG